MMNISTWKLLLTASCMACVSTAFSAPVGTGTVHFAGGAATVRPLARPHLSLIAPARLVRHSVPKHTAAQIGAYRYMDAVPSRNPNHIHAAVMSLPHAAAKKNQCEAMTGSARQHCFELMMPT